MAYTKQTWTNGVSKLNATRMQHIEDGLEAAAIVADDALDPTIIDAKGDLIVGSAADTAIRKAVGANDTVVVADSAQTGGIKWTQIGNAQVASSAAIAYSKLNLASSIVNADISASAAIALSKLASNAWTTYTPTWAGSTTNPVIGNGTLSGRYIQLGKIVIAQMKVVPGSTTTFGSGSYSLSLPVAARDSSWSLGVARLVDTGTANFHGTAVDGGSSTVFVITGTSSIWGPTTPYTMASADIALVLVVYEAA